MCTMHDEIFLSSNFAMAENFLVDDWRIPLCENSFRGVREATPDEVYIGANKLRLDWIIQVSSLKARIQACNILMDKMKTLGAKKILPDSEE